MGHGAIRTRIVRVKMLYLRTSWSYDVAVIPIGRSLGRAHKMVHAYGDRELAPYGATVTDYVLLFQIDQAPPPGLSQTEIARYSNMGGPALVRHLDRLERDGIVVRARDETDRRIMRVTLTDAGRKRLAELLEVVERIDAEYRAVLTEEEAEILQRALDKLFEHTLGELYGGVSPAPAFTPHRPPQPPTRRQR
jgi:DNA-binding MarR family transcriptional regulator